jgi:3-oxoacyl-(acyl-carrier-protein) synthase
MSARPGIVVTGVGVVCPLGIDVGSFWAGALSGATATVRLTRFGAGGLSPRHGGEVGSVIGWDPGDGSRTDSLAVAFASAASAMAVKDAGLGTSFEEARAGLCFGSVMATRPAVERQLLACSPSSSEAVTDLAWANPSLISRLPAEELGFGGPNCLISTACASGNTAIAYSADLLRAEKSDVMVAGGADELSHAMLMMFDSFHALAPDVVRPFDLRRRGLLLAEGAAALVLERESDARARGADIYGRVLGYSNTADAHHITSPHPDGRGAVTAILGALAQADAAPGDLDYISAHGTGTRSNDTIEASAIRAVLGVRADEVPVSSLKGSLGHAQGAASAIEAVGCLLALRDGLLPPTANYDTADPDCAIDVVAGNAREKRPQLVLNNAFGFGGNVECIVFGAP